MTPRGPLERLRWVPTPERGNEGGIAGCRAPSLAARADAPASL